MQKETKNKFRQGVLLAMLLVTSGLSAQTLKVCTGREYQTIDGFGASDAWRCQMVGKYWPQQKKDTLADWLFSKEVDSQGNPKGIGLSFWRFYIGAGSMEQGEESHISDEWRRAECFQLPDGSYDWHKQEGQRWFLRAAKQRGVEKFLAFTISPPVQMTLNGKAFSSQKERMNIRWGMMTRYAGFLVDCIENLQKNEGITFDYLSPINEPQWDWMPKNGDIASQEGTPATNREMYELVTLLSGKLNRRGLSTRIALGEAAAVNYLYGDVNGEQRDNQIDDFWNPTSPLCIASLPNVEPVITSHSYFSVWPLADQIMHRRTLNDKIKQYPGLKYWQTEYCVMEHPGDSIIPGGGGGRRDLGMKTALFVARIIHNDLTVANASSWQWWTALTRADYKDGLIYLDDGNSNGGQSPDYCRKNGEMHASKLMWALGNYARFIRPGMKRIEVSIDHRTAPASNLLVSAYKDATARKLVIVAVNTANEEYTCKLEIDKKMKGRKLIPYLTSETCNLKKGAAVSMDKVNIPPQSVVTFTLQ